MFDLKSRTPDEWHRFIQGDGNGHQLKLLVTANDLPYALRESRIVGTDVYFEMRNEETPRISGGGEVIPDRGLLRYTLPRPIGLDEEGLLELERNSPGRNSPLPKRAWVVYWLRRN